VSILRDHGGSSLNYAGIFTWCPSLRHPPHSRSMSHECYIRRHTYTETSDASIQHRLLHVTPNLHVPQDYARGVCPAARLPDPEDWAESLRPSTYSKDARLPADGLRLVRGRICGRWWRDFELPTPPPQAECGYRLRYTRKLVGPGEPSKPDFEWRNSARPSSVMM